MDELIDINFCNYIKNIKEEFAKENDCYEDSVSIMIDADGYMIVYSNTSKYQEVYRKWIGC